MNFSALQELRRRHLLQVAVAYTGASSLPVIAQPIYPEKPVRIIHAYPGAPLDAAARFMADKLSAAWKQPVLVDTRPGASELIAGDAVAKARPDGYTLFVGAESNFTNNQFLYAKLPFNPERDLVPVTELYQLPFCLIVPGDFAANTLAEFVALLKRPGADYASRRPALAVLNSRWKRCSRRSVSGCATSLTRSAPR